MIVITENYRRKMRREKNPQTSFHFLFFNLFEVLTFDKQKDISENENGGDYEYIFFNESLNEMVQIIKK
jgi:hypothetical protein